MRPHAYAIRAPRRPSMDRQQRKYRNAVRQQRPAVDTAHRHRCAASPDQHRHRSSRRRGCGGLLISEHRGVGRHLHPASPERRCRGRGVSALGTAAALTGTSRQGCRSAQRHAHGAVNVVARNPPLHQEPHHRPRRIRASDFDEASGGEHRHGSGVDGRARHPISLEGGHIDRMPLDGRRTMFAGKLDGGLQQRRSDAGSPVPAVDYEARHPPDSDILVIQHSRESPVAAYPGKPGAESHSGPTDRMIIDVGDEPRCNRSMRDLLIQRVAIVGRHFRGRGCRVL